MKTQPARGMQPAELLALPAAVDLATAARALNVGRTTAYDLAKRGQFPVPTLRLGVQYRVRRADLLNLLGIEQPATASPAA
ncbi:helix-turn-helix domain-containing protein [Streptomyces sp. MAR25Y5]|uniref:helix-turn-helix domain-containing protein n=1 Tax=Streptomyces sp. MAR25Y5 TaxID=2962028 RepID=UPI0035A8BF7F